MTDPNHVEGKNRGNAVHPSEPSLAHIYNGITFQNSR